ncbi:gluconokinase [Stagnihabitans tardus]|uniref:Gluconokinase n=1 Tax=Stagnihabitans tardus TaxID=2699202 RepID=A0AAE4Y6I8_9RHOB|nr:gluconokinase [Stagnihabitans tardus]NBZ86743.1 gluconokinase [Stagnihabitans tardus]
MKLVVMGVSGCGKSSVGEGIARALGLPYVDGDDLHPPENVEKMRASIPLTDEDRWPWLDRVAETLARDCIIGCSALKRRYRDRIRLAGDVQFLYLTGSKELIAARMAARKNHYMPPSLLDSQFAALEPPGPDEAISVDIDQPLADIIAQALRSLR